MNITQKPHLHQDWVDPHAVGIVRALQRKGHTTYLVGGCVRDLLLGIHPKDYDIATDARPDEVKRTIHRAYIIGKRFRLVLVRRDDQQFEVATFRRELRDDDNPENLPSGDNIFGTPEEDAQRRDFTINALFYDPSADQLIDFAEGMKDLEARVIRMIGDPMVRLAEDPIRIMRALRLKHMIGFSFDSDLRKAMQEMASTLPSTALPRRREEILKWLKLKHADLAFREAHDLGILKHVSPTLDEALGNPEASEIFYGYLQQIPTDKDAGLTPALYFGLLTQAYVRAFMQAEPDASTESRHVFDDEKFNHWMREELGMFKYEQSVTVKAFHVEALLAKRKEFQKRGDRRQRALVTNESFPLAHLMAKQDYLCAADDMHFWSTLAERYADEAAPVRSGYGDRGSNPVGSGGPRRRRRRRPRGPRREGASPVSDASAPKEG